MLRAFWNRVLRRIVLWPALVKCMVAMAADASALVFSAVAAVLLIHPFFNPGESGLALVFAGPVLSLPILYAFGAYRVVVRFIGPEFFQRLMLAMLAVTACLVLLSTVLGLLDSSWNEAVIFGAIGFCNLSLLRSLARRFLSLAGNAPGLIRVLIYGAGEAGTQLAASLAMSRTYKACGFVDTRGPVSNRVVMGLHVHEPDQLRALQKKGKFDQIFLAIPSASRARQRQILEELAPLATKVMVMPSLDDLASGKKRVDEVREVQVEDLLGRDPVAPVDRLLARFIKDKVVMVTGAGGSIGSELARIILQSGARKLVLYEMSEFSLYNIERELRAAGKPCEIVPVLGSVLEQQSLTRVMAAEGVHTVYHAAAYKHVPLGERNVLATVHNNVIGTFRAIEAAVKSNVENFVLISTDKAVRPTSVMGASKRVCELIVQAYAQRFPKMCMSMVRFGNVLASSGSVVPLFEEQISRGGPVTVTDPEMTRYFMTIPEAAQLVIQAAAMGEGGEVFVLDMGTPVKILDLATRMVHLAGLEVRSDQNPAGDIEIKFTGLRPGEKLYEELLIGDDPQLTQHPRIFRARETFLAWNQLSGYLGQLELALETGNQNDALATLWRLVGGRGLEEAADIALARRKAMRVIAGQ